MEKTGGPAIASVAGNTRGSSRGTPPPFTSYASAWLERKRATIARSTYGDYLSIWKKYVLPHFGDVPLCRVTLRDVDDFLGTLGGISERRKNNILVPLKCLFHDAARRGDIEEPPTAHIRKFREAKPFAGITTLAPLPAEVARVSSRSVLRSR